MNSAPKLPIRTIRMDMTGLRGAVFGVVNAKSIGYDLVEYARSCGAEITLHCRRQDTVDKLKRLCAPIGVEHVYFGDVEKSGEMDACFDNFAKHGDYDFVLHCIAGSNPEEMQRPQFEVTRENFLHTMEVSAYSFQLIAQRMAPLMPRGGGMVALSYRASVHPFPNYNVMGDAKATLEAIGRRAAYYLGERGIWVIVVRTSAKESLSSRAIGNRKLIGLLERANSLRGGRATRDQIKQGLAAFLTIDMGMTGREVDLDNGAGVPGMFHPRNAEIIERLGHDVATVRNGGKAEFPPDYFNWDE